MRITNQSEEDEPPFYAVRFAEAARDEIDQEYVRLVGISGIDVADDWQSRLLEAIRSLATYPERCVLAPEDQQFQRVRPGIQLRVLIYWRTRSGPAWRILFSVQEANILDPPTVRVRHIWHSARAPITFWPAEDE
ncbi:MAG: type II toxin-antitoxin system RelE/ParE family toxin [Armatimonadota bacterium]|nr:type II toxin-antitoxin system RelE/ParE family toxin [Armatimonadota bacterium]